MKKQLSSFSNIVRQPTAFVPLAMSVTALALVLGSLAVHGIVRQPDEGAIAHLWQLLMAGQLPIVAFFAWKWVPRLPRQGAVILAMQVAAGLASAAPVFFLHL